MLRGGGEKWLAFESFVKLESDYWREARKEIGVASVSSSGGLRREVLSF